MKDITTKEEIIKAGGIIGLKYRGKDFPRYALLKDGSLYFKLANGLYRKQKIHFNRSIKMYNYMLRSFINNKAVDSTQMLPAALVLENFKNINCENFVINYKDNDSTNASLDNLEYSYANIVLYGIIRINILENFYHKFNSINFLPDKIIFNDEYQVKYKIDCLMNLIKKSDLEELKLATTVFDKDAFDEYAGYDNSANLRIILRCRYNLRYFVIDYSCLMDITIKEFIAICKIAKKYGIHDIVKVKQDLKQIKPSLSESDIIKIMKIIYSRLKPLDLDSIIKVLESYDGTNMDYTIYQLRKLKMLVSIICYLFKIDTYYLKNNARKKDASKGDVHE